MACEHRFKKHQTGECLWCRVDYQWYKATLCLLYPYALYLRLKTRLKV